MTTNPVTETISPVSAIAESIERLWKREKWHKTRAGGWIGDAIYGVNDGLGAIFGIIAGVAGYTANNQDVLISGFFGAGQYALDGCRCMVSNKVTDGTAAKRTRS